MAKKRPMNSPLTRSEIETVQAGGIYTRTQAKASPLPPNTHQWGQRKQVNKVPAAGGNDPPWALGQIKPILTLDAAEMLKVTKGFYPHTQAVLLQTDGFNPADTGVYSLRWVVEFGTGGARTQFKIDADGAQLITVPAEALRVYLQTELLFANANPASYQRPSLSFFATAFFAEGTTSTDAPTYTVGYQIAAGAQLAAFPPPGATAWRICGQSPLASTLSPFTGFTDYRIARTGAVIDQYYGSDLFGVRIADISFPGSASFLSIDNTANANAIELFVEWGIDL